MLDTYDPDTAPDRAAWLALDESTRISLATRAHKGRFPDPLHAEGANEVAHGALHAIVETQIASREPPATAAAVARLVEEGLKRHAAVHAVMTELAAQLAALREGGRFAHDAYSAAIGRLTASGVVGSALQAPPAGSPLNRAQRRAARKEQRKGKGTGRERE